MNNKYYWLKLKKDFFKRHDIRIVEEMPNGKDYILFYMKLLLESIDHEGELRFSDTIPYNESMLATITNTNVDIVRSAMQVFTELKMIDILDDGTVFMTEVQKMIGSASNSDTANRQRRFRENKKQELCANNSDSVTKCNAGVTLGVTKDNESKSIDKDKDKDKDKELDICDKQKKSRFIPPTIEEVRAYCRERNSSVDPDKFFEYFQTGNWKDSKGNPVKNWKQKIITWEKFNNDTDRQEPKRDEVLRLAMEMAGGNTNDES